MSKLQTLVLDRLETEIGKRYGLIVTDEKVAANVGRLNLVHPITLDVAAFVTYDFQTRYFSLGAYAYGETPGRDRRRTRTTVNGLPVSTVVQGLIDDVDGILGGADDTGGSTTHGRPVRKGQK